MKKYILGFIAASVAATSGLIASEEKEPAPKKFEDRCGDCGKGKCSLEGLLAVCKKPRKAF